MNKKLKLTSSPITLRPFIYTKPSVSAINRRLLVFLSCQIAMLFITKSFSAGILVITCALSALFAAILLYRFKKFQKFEITSLVLQGIFVGMFLPESYPIIVIFFITFITIFISRGFIFQNINSWLNIPCFIVLIAWIIGENFFPDFLLDSNLILSKNPSNYLIQNGSFPIYEFDSSITSYLNTNLFRFLKVTLPEGFISLLWDTGSSIPAFRFNIITLLSSAIIFADDSHHSVIPLSFLVSYGILVRCFAQIFFGGSLNQGDIILAFCTSGTLFTAIFMLQSFGTSPVKFSNKIIFGLLAGLIAFFIVGSGTSPIGMIYTILCCNFVNLFIRVFEEKANIKKMILASTELSKQKTSEA